MTGGRGDSDARARAISGRASESGRSERRAGRSAEARLGWGRLGRAGWARLRENGAAGLRFSADAGRAR